LKKKTGQNFVFGALILMVSNVIVKMIGAMFKIPLTNLIGLRAMAYFNAANSIYVSFYMISTAGIPVVISRMIAASNTKGNAKEVKKIFNIAYYIFLFIGILGTTIMIAFSRFFAKSAALPNSYYAMIAIAPTLFFICLSSAYRGYFQGLQNMVPTAISQVIEAVGKISIGLIAGWYCISNGFPMHKVAAFVILGVTIGVAAGTVYMHISKVMYNNVLKAEIPLPEEKTLPCRSNKSILKELCLTALPIAISASIMGLTNVVDTMLVTKRLMFSGLTNDIATQFYGAYTSMTIPLFNMPPILIYPFAISAIPVLSAALVKNDFKKTKGTVESTFRITSIISIPCALGLSALSYPVLKLLYSNVLIEGTKLHSLDIAAPALSVMAIAIFFMSMISITNSVLQAWRKENKPIYATTFGILVKIISAYFLLAIPNFGIMGAAISSALCYFTIMSINLYFVIKTTGYIPNIGRVFLKPFISGLLCTVVALSFYHFTTGFLSIKISVLIALILAVLVYFVLLAFFHGLYREDMILLPKGEKICALFEKLHILTDSGEK